MTLQEAIKLLRYELNLSQEDLAQRINKAFVTVNRWENGKSFPSRKNALDLLDIAVKYNASKECISYLNSVLLPYFKRSRTGVEYGFPNIDKDFLFQLADNSINGVYVIDANTFELIYANKQTLKLSQKYLQEVGDELKNKDRLGKNDRRCFSYLASKAEPCSFCHLGKALSSIYTNTTISVPETGTIYSVRSIKKHLKNREVYIVYLTDITLASKERESLNVLTRDSIDAVGIYNLYSDSRLELIFMNDAYYQMIGKMRPQQLMKFGVTSNWLVHPEDKASLIDNSSSDILRMNLRMLIEKNKYVLVHIDARPIKKTSEKTTYYCTFTKV